MNAKRNEIQSKLPKRLLYSLLGLAFIIIAFLLLLYPVIIERTEKAAIIRIPANATSAMVHDSIAKYYGNCSVNSIFAAMRLHSRSMSRNPFIVILTGVCPPRVRRRIAVSALDPSGIS